MYCTCLFHFLLCCYLECSLCGGEGNAVDVTTTTTTRMGDSTIAGSNGDSTLTGSRVDGSVPGSNTISRASSACSHHFNNDSGAELTIVENKNLKKKRKKRFVIYNLLNIYFTLLAILL